MYHNTTNLAGNELNTRRDRAKTQDETVLDVFRKAGEPLKPSEVLKIGFTSSTPLTSVRRSVTTLTEEGYLRKTEKMGEGKYGSPEHFWELV